MTDPYSESLPHGDFRPEDFRTPAQGGLEISAAFVDATLARVLAERAEIDHEAARVDEIAFADEFLQSFAAPVSSADFVARTWSRIQADRSHQEARFEALIATFDVPSTHPDFVSRTLDALRVDRSGFRLVGDQTERPTTTPQPRARWMAAAAAIALLALAWAFWPGTTPITSSVDTAVESAQRFTPVAWATALERINEQAAGGIRFEPVDALQLLAAEAAGGIR